MTSEAECPMCGQRAAWEFDAGVCGYCRMGVSAGAPYYVVTGDARRAVLCSPQCVLGYVATSRARGMGSEHRLAKSVVNENERRQL